MHPSAHSASPLFERRQEVSRERWIEIPEPIRDVYRIWRPTPLIRASGLEKALGTPARIYYKWEGASPIGSHKGNTAIAQAYYNKAEGTTRIATETGAGQWGSAMAFAAQMFGIECKVYMVRVSYDQKPYRRILMETYGASVVASPSAMRSPGVASSTSHTDSQAVRCASIQRSSSRSRWSPASSTNLSAMVRPAMRT